MRKVCPLVLFLLSSLSSVRQSSSSDSLPYLYLGKNVSKCGLDSPELFYWEVAEPAISILKEETHGFFGILMDKLEASMDEDDEDSTEEDEEEKEALEKRWLYIMKVLQKSLDNAVLQLRKSWGLFVVVSDTPTLPWEGRVTHTLLKEFLNEVEYQYMLVGAVIKAGVKEIVGSLQKQLSLVIKELEVVINKLTSEEEHEIEKKLLVQMDHHFSRMKPSFVNLLIMKMVRRGILSRLQISDAHHVAHKLYFSDLMKTMAIAFEAYRQKGHEHPAFWKELTTIMVNELRGAERDPSEFLQLLNTDKDMLLDNVFGILISEIPTLSRGQAQSQSA